MFTSCALIISALPALILSFVLAGWLSPAWAQPHPPGPSPDKVIAVIPPDSPPTYYRDKQTGKPAGFAVDIMDAVAKRAGLRAEYIFEDGWSDIIEKVNRGEADLIPGMGVSAERRKDLAFSTSIDAFPISFFIRAGHPGLDKKPGIHTVGVIKGSVAYEHIKDRPDIRINMYESFAQGLFDLLAGKIEAFACPEPTLWQLAREMGMEDHIEVVDKPIAEITRSIAVRKDDIVLLARLNSAIEGFVGTPAYQDIYSKWYGKQLPYWTPMRVSLIGSVVLIIVILLMAGWRYYTVVNLNRVLRESIAGWKQAEESRLESEIKFRAVFEKSQDAIGVSLAGVHVFVNPAYLKLFGYQSNAELEGRPVLDLIASAARDRIIDHIRKRASGQEVPAAYETRGLRQDGTEFDMDVHASTYDLGGKTYTLVILRDITEQIQTRGTVQLNQDRLESLVNISQHQTENMQELLDYTLEEAIRLTKSRIGYIYLYSEEKQEFTLNTWSRDVMKQCSVNEPQRIYNLDKTGIWGEAVRQRKPIMIQDFHAPHALKRGYPEGHAPLHNFLTVPVFRGDRIVAVIGAANKTGNYDQSDISQLTLLMEAVWRMAERKQIESALKESEAVLRSFMNAITESALLLDREGRILTANETVARRLESTLPELMGRSAYDLLPPDVGRTRKTRIDEVFRSGKPARFEDERHGRIIDNSMYPVFDPEGKVAAVAIIGFDITEQKRAEAALQKSEKQIRDIASTLGEGVYVLNDRGEVTFMNPEAERLLGWTEAEILNRNIHDIVHHFKSDGTVLSFADCPMHNVIHSAKRYSSHDEVFVRRDGSTFPVSVITSPLVENGTITASVTAFRDISDLKRAEQEREKLITELQNALSEIKTLHGIIPICASCKKIRNDKGAWQQMESYISEHSSAEFSHGICLDCARRLYPDYFKGYEEKEQS